MTSASGTVPDGWEICEANSPFERLIGPNLRRRSSKGWTYGFVAHDKLANEAGTVHGGAIAALFDDVLGTIINGELGRGHVTVQLSTMFVAAINIGDFVEIQHDIISATGSMTFVEGRLVVGSKIAAKASMVFKARRHSPA